MPRKDYLSADQRLRFDAPPELQDKRILFEIPHWAETYLKKLTTATNKVGFILQLGYFRVASRFFNPSHFPERDISLMAVRLHIDPNEKITLYDYAQSQTMYRHQEKILAGLGYHAFNSRIDGITAQQLLFQETKRLAALQTKPDLMFDVMVTYLQEKRVEVPSYTTLHDILAKALDAFSKDLEAIIQTHLLESDKALLDGFARKEHLSPGETKRDDYRRYELTFFKKISQSMQPMFIKERVDLFVELKKKYIQLQPIIKRLHLSDATIRYFADYVLVNQSAQSINRVNEYYLQLIAFVIHQYFSLGDALTITLMGAVTTTFNNAEEQLKGEYYQSRHANAQLIHQVSRRSSTHIHTLDSIENIVDDEQTGDTQKIQQIRQLLHQKQMGKTALNEDKERLNTLSKINQPVYERDDYYGSLEKESIKLQHRVSNIVVELVFDTTTAQKDIAEAVVYFQQKKGDIIQNQKLPVEFLDMFERQKIFTEPGKLRVSLYKALLFREVKEHIKAGSLNIASSYEYRSFEEYLIPKNKWMKDKESFLKNAGLSKHNSTIKTIADINQQLTEQLKIANQNLPDNKTIHFDTQGGWHLERYRRQVDESAIDNSLLYPPNRSIAILQALTQINQLTGFLDAFQHKTTDYTPPRPSDTFFYAAIIGFGENIGIPEMAAISKGVTKNTLETVATHYFSPGMTLKANDLILAQSNSLPIIDLFRQQKGFIHTGSDGQKYDVSVPSLRASASFKYFGNSKGITVYSHLDEAGQLIFSTVFSASEKEAHHLLDCLTYNEVITPDAHSTDSHGFTEAVAAITGLLGIDFRPRLAGLHKRQLYCFDAVSNFKEQGYKIRPDAKIDQAHLMDQWDEILRMTATIKLGYHKASTLFKRLNSYARKHPLYKALTDLGRIYRTIYTLRYIDQPELRKSVEGVLSIVEHANNLALAITQGNNQQLMWALQEDQLKAEGCKRLMMNTINCYNLLLLSEKHRKCQSKEEKQQLLKIIEQSSTHTWRHFNLSGTYDFSEVKTGTFFDIKAIMATKINR